MEYAIYAVCVAGGMVAGLAGAQTLDKAHPIITEILYAVPSGEGGDADQSGARSATGDEFIELYNAGEKAIELKGYRLMDGLPTVGKAASDAKSHIEFTFPQATLAPGQAVVVFNGFGSEPKGNVGDATAAKPANEFFHGALVFSMKCANQYQALSNSNDMVVLVAPDGTALQCVRWDNRDEQRDAKKESGEGESQGKGKASRGKGKRAEPADKAAPEAARVMQDAPKATGSVTLTSVDGEFAAHMDAKAVLFSPGVFDAGNAASKPATDQRGTPEQAKPAKQKGPETPK